MGTGSARTNVSPRSVEHRATACYDLWPAYAILDRMLDWDDGQRRGVASTRRRGRSRPRTPGLAGNLNALRTGAYSGYMSQIYRCLPPQTRAFLRVATATALATTLADVPAGRDRLAIEARQRARLRALYGVVQLLGTVDLSAPKTKAGVHLAVVRALGPVFLDPSLLQAELRPLPVEWPPIEGDDVSRATRRRRRYRHEAY